MPPTKKKPDKSKSGLVFDPDAPRRAKNHVRLTQAARGKQRGSIVNAPHHVCALLVKRNKATWMTEPELAKAKAKAAEAAKAQAGDAPG